MWLASLIGVQSKAVGACAPARTQNLPYKSQFVPGPTWGSAAPCQSPSRTKDDSGRELLDKRRKEVWTHDNRSGW
jgi:hypothetical protein